MTTTTPTTTDHAAAFLAALAASMTPTPTTPDLAEGRVALDAARDAYRRHLRTTTPAACNAPDHGARWVAARAAAGTLWHPDMSTMDDFGRQELVSLVWRALGTVGALPVGASS
jgi:hypothetical protein